MRHAPEHSSGRSERHVVAGVVGDDPAFPHPSARLRPQLLQILVIICSLAHQVPTLNFLSNFVASPTLAGTLLHLNRWLRKFLGLYVPVTFLALNWYLGLVLDLKLHLEDSSRFKAVPFRGGGAYIFVRQPGKIGFLFLFCSFPVAYRFEVPGAEGS